MIKKILIAGISLLSINLLSMNQSTKEGGTTNKKISYVEADGKIYIEIPGGGVVVADCPSGPSKDEEIADFLKSITEGLKQKHE